MERIWILSALFITACILPLGKAEFQCNGVDMKFNATQLQQTRDCLGYHGKKSIWQLKTEDFPCFGMCMFTSRGFIGDDGEHLVVERVMDYIEMVAPDKAKEHLKTMLKGCVEEHGKKIRAKNEDGCMSFMEAGRCFRDSFFEGCVGND